jgi:drug/metabolite transporter (DMT)-like permease
MGPGPTRSLLAEPTLRGVLLALTSALGFGLIPIFALYAYRGSINVNTLLLIRFSLAALLLFGLLAARRRSLRPALSALGPLALLGLCYTLQSGSYFSAVRFIPVSLASLILYSYPALVCLLAFLVERERPNARTLAALAVSLAGVVLVLGTAFGRVDLRGVLYALGAAGVYSAYITLANRVLRRVEPITTIAFVSLFAAAGYALLGAAMRTVDFHFAPWTWLAILGLLGVSTLLAIFAFFRSLELLGPTWTSIISMTEPLFTIGLSALLFAERLTLLQAAGGVLVLGGTARLTVVRRRACGPPA